MCGKENEKFLTKIKKVLELSRNNPSEEEAKAAELKVQRLMAEYHLTMEYVDGIGDDDNIMEVHVQVGTGNKWKGALASVIVKNFICKYFYYGKVTVVFYGYRVDAEIAWETFKFLFNFRNKKAIKYYMQMRSKAVSTKGIKNAYLIGYLEGIQEVLEKQYTALMIITPKK